MHCILVGKDAMIELPQRGHFMYASICRLRCAVSRITLVGSGTPARLAFVDSVKEDGALDEGSKYRVRDDNGVLVSLEFGRGDRERSPLELLLPAKFQPFELATFLLSCFLFGAHCGDVIDLLLALVALMLDLLHELRWQQCSKIGNEREFFSVDAIWEARLAESVFHPK